ncbi:MAG: GNAT family N-acetyltransferase [Candidatus Abyssobacteria bacterium SURF_5]|uniref:GNAT family N-acetyltransferase n=1 Tax=Abyssobacteria bacterium (strain SURF_5) TaxID=2093360 RepID=A0A3A4N0S7_ABYX5|nr:MAG: GNAT family N-acetyltransferase [Candidatus Abyssubacteria bacterium SURF_5]
MIQENISFKLWDDSEEAGILALVRQDRGATDTRFAEYFDWEYRRNPLGRAIIGIGKKPDGMVVTALAAVPTPVVFRGAPLMACQLVNGMTRSDYMGRGLFSECGRMVCDALKRSGIALSYGLPNPNSFPSLTRKIGYSDIGTAKLLVFLHNPAALAAVRFPAARILGAAGIDRRLARFLLKKPRIKAAVQSRRSFNGLPLERLREDADLALDPNIDWLNWRYTDVPRRPYRIITTGGDDAPSGVAVYRLSLWDRVRITTINDLFLPPQHEPEAVESLIAHIISESESGDCAATFCLVAPGSRKEEILTRLGFVVVPHRFEPQPFSVILQGHSVSISGMTVREMAVSFGAYDIF